VSRVLKKKIVVLIAVPVLLFLISLFWGRYHIDPFTAIKVLLSKVFPITPTWVDSVETVIFRIRLPRAIVAMMVGASLSISGASYQGMFRNPLVSPDILGVSAAAGFGAALAILMSLNAVMIQVLALVFGIAGVIITYMISRVFRTTPVLMLVLSGVVVGAFFSAMISITKYVADPYTKLPAITFWLMGSLSTASARDILTILPSMLIGSTGLLLVRWRINILAMGDEEARSMGIRTELLKGVVIFCSTILSASAVCVSGIIGWVGLVIPHIARMLVGPDHRVLLPASICIGAAYLLFIDNLARTVTTAEIPLGILTAILGAPFFAYLLRRTRGGWQ
jgi:iron complex transport system permease protein